jgi:hypothetical protein
VVRDWTQRQRWSKFTRSDAGYRLQKEIRDPQLLQTAIAAFEALYAIKGPAVHIIMAPERQISV